MRYKSAIFSALLIATTNIVFALPTGGQVAAGSATISQSGTTTAINQSSPSAVINWQGFDTTKGESVVFNQPNVDSTVLNRINSGLPTNFAGSLTANGKVFIVNPAGMVFAKGANVNAASIIATTADINDQDFMAGNYQFFAQPGHENASIINNGTLTAGNFSERVWTSGIVALIAPNIVTSESSAIYAGSGAVVLATGKTFVLDFNNDQLINFDSSALVKGGHIESKGLISAVSGKVFMTTNTVYQLLDNMISTSGVTEARTVVVNSGKKTGEIILAGQDANAGKIIITGEIHTAKMNLKADRGIDLGNTIDNGTMFTAMGEKREAGDELIAKTETGNINLNNNSYMYIHNVTLSAPKGAITQANLADFSINNLTTTSARGTKLGSEYNEVKNFTASNSISGGIYLKVVRELENINILQAAGGYKIDT